MSRPKCKDMVGKIIRLHADCVTRCGSVFYKGELLQVRSMDKNGKMELFRPLGVIVTEYDPKMEVIGDKTIFNNPALADPEL